jgi:hypothetical protein
MEPEAMDYAKMLSDARAKRAALDGLIASLEAAWAAGAVGQGQGPAPSMNGPLAGPRGGGLPSDLPKGALLGKSLAEAIRLYLGVTKTKQSVREIAKALKEEGVESTSDNFESVVAASLNGKKGTVFLRFKDGWSLADLYPNFRSGTTQERVQKTRKRKGKRKVAKEEKEDQIQRFPRFGLETQIFNLLKKEPTRIFSSGDVTQELEANSSGVSLALGRMAGKGKIEKVSHGKYRAMVGGA